MFQSQVASYNADRRLGVAATSVIFDRSHPLYRVIAKLSALRTAHAALRSGRQIVRYYSSKPGLFAVSRLDPASGREIVIAFNTATEPLTARVEVDTASQRFSALHGQCVASVTAPGSYEVTLAPLDFVVCAS
jgi:glycosidase